MTPLRQRMLGDMQLRGLAERTQESCPDAVRRLAEYFGWSPDRAQRRKTGSGSLQFRPRWAMIQPPSLSSRASWHQGQARLYSIPLRAGDAADAAGGRVEGKLDGKQRTEWDGAAVNA